MSGYGFGICGHKNEYSSGVLCGNWAQEQKPQKDVAIKTKSKFKGVIPSEKILNNFTPRNDIKYLSGKEIARKNQMSLSYSSLFGHNHSRPISNKNGLSAYQIFNGEECSKAKNCEKKNGIPNFKNAIKVQSNNCVEKFCEEKNDCDDRDSCMLLHPAIPDFKRRKVQIHMSSGAIF